MLEPVTFTSTAMTYAVIITVGEPAIELIGPVNKPEYAGEFLVMAVTRRQEYAETLKLALERFYSDFYGLETPTGQLLSFQVVPAMAKSPAPTSDNCLFCSDTY